jgi:hypothetical protein
MPSIDGTTVDSALKFCALCPTRYYALHNLFTKFAIGFDKTISLKEIISIDESGESSWKENCLLYNPPNRCCIVSVWDVDY